MTFVGTVEVSANKQKELREQIVSLCQQDEFKNVCLWQGLDSHSSNVDLSLQISTDTTTTHQVSTRSLESIPLHPYFHSTFCFSPGGDFPTRKGFLDAMLSGCIPVTFQLATAQEQWLAHWGSFQQAMDCTVYIHREEFMENPTKFFQQLIEWNRNSSFIAEKLTSIRKVAHRFQYSRPLHSGREDDAVDVTLRHFMKNIRRDKRGLS
jgi:hypothetical protein